MEQPCPVCGEVFTSTAGFKSHLRAHERKSDPEYPTDEPPRQRTPKHAKGGAQISSMTVEAQLRLIYEMVGTLTAARAPVASGAIKRQAAACAKADEQLLRRWPKVYEAMEKGLIAGDVLAVLMAHYPILAAVREELEIRRREQMIAEGEGGGVPGVPFEHQAA